MMKERNYTNLEASLPAFFDRFNELIVNSMILLVCLRRGGIDRLRTDSKVCVGGLDVKTRVGASFSSDSLRHNIAKTDAQCRSRITLEAM